MAGASEFVLEPLRRRVDFTLYRGRERGDPTPILAVAVAAEQQSPQHLRRLEHEYSLASELDSAWAARPLALARQGERAVLILEDPGGEPLDQAIERHNAQPVDLTRFLRIAIGLTSALGQAHGRGLIHKDIKPANALVDGSGRVWLTGFGIASRVPRERQSPADPEIIAGSLPYMAPEQTGRMNRSIDSRSDLYSLGITLYEMSTGRLPFIASDPVEWVHCQIARQPVPPRQQAPHVPAQVSAIIMKLLAKTAEERFQTAAGLERDLRRCLEAWETRGRIDLFPLGANDKPDRLLIPEKLYGRTSETNTLLAAFDRVVGRGKPELILVSGYSGVGKSSVVNELHKPLVPPRGLFASGKFDQYKRDIPYATLAQAFQYLVRPILAKSEEELGHWRDSFREALDPNGRLIVDLVPELKLIIGEQPPVPELPPQDAQNRFQLVFRRFISAFTQKHPLALFLDDLQWLDEATLDLMENLLTHPDVKHLMLIGAYRDNEVDPTHPLMRRLGAIRKAGATVHEIALGPLTHDDLEELIADSLHCERGRARPLAELVEQKTRGNPFFSIHFISTLFEEELLVFDHAKGVWCWDLNLVHAKCYTDNVVDLMVAKLNRLPIETQKALQQLACLGIGADFSMLRLANQESSEEMHEQLWEAVRTGLILRSEDSYRFLHDRVQEAAYSQIPQEILAQTHLRIGMSMAARTSREKLEEGIFEIVNQLNRGVHLITSIAEHECVAELNLIAGRRAKNSTAYASALKHLHVGRGLLTDDAWNRNYDLVFSIEYLLAECELLTADVSNSERRLAMLAEQARTPHDISLVTRLRLTLYTLLDRNDRSVEVFIEYERGHGRDWSQHPLDEDVLREYDQIMSFVKDKNIGSLVDLPLIADPDVLDVLDVFTEVVMSAMITDKNLLALVIFRMISISLKHGNSDASCFAYVALGMLAGARFGNFEAGFQFGKLGYDLVEKRGLHRYRARVYLRFGNQVMPWRRHVKAGRELVRRAFDVASRSGDLTFAGYSCNNLTTNLLAAGDSLAEVQREAEAGLEFAKSVRFDRVIDMITAQLGLIRTLRGLTAEFGSFNDQQLDELRFERHLSGGSAESWYWIRKLQARFFAGDYPSAIDASLNAKRLSLEPDSYFEVAEYHFYAALTRAGASDSTAEGSRQGHLKALADHHTQLAIWAKNCPENFENRAALVGAEIARIEGRDLDAMHLYEQAIHSAHANGFVQNEAIAYEVAGRFFLARGIKTARDAYLRNARTCYDRWGATGKVRQLDEHHPHLRDERPPAFPAAIGSSVGLLDVETVVKASQALSSEMILPRLIERLMRIAVEHAGAERGLLLLIRGGEPYIEAEATTGLWEIEVAARRGVITTSDLPQSVLHYAIRTKGRVLLDDASSDDMYCEDSYVRLKCSRSILCLPIVKQAKLVGALYLENNLTPGAFTPDRVAVLDLLASQAAISLENAALYTDLQRSEAFLAHGQRISHTGTFGWSNASGKYYWSAENYNILEYDRKVEPSAELALQRMHPDDRVLVRRLLNDAIGENKDIDSEHRLLMPDGRIKYIHTTGRAVSSGNLDFVGAVRDVTERVRVEETLRQAQSDLARVARVATLNAMTVSIAHEVSQPLSGILTNAEVCVRMLAADPPNLAGAVETAQRTMRDANRASEVIMRLRAMFSNKGSTIESVDINVAAREVIALSAGELQRSGALVQTAFANGLPLVSADRVQLQQVILNLLLNAADAMAGVVDRPRVLRIETELLEDGSVKMAVRDSGTGVDPQTLEKLFEAFYTTKPNGMGVGLSICRSIVENHDGRLWAVANDGPGATFSFCVPCAPRGRS